MSIITNHALCGCNSICTNTHLPNLVASPCKPDRPHKHFVDQDVTDPTSFFRLPLEIREKIYFLSMRPDCQHSFGRSIECSKQHLHQSALGRHNQWKWLSLCRQTWAEAIQYHPIFRQETKIKVKPDDCARCFASEYDFPLLESALHAKLKPKLGGEYRMKELWLARISKVLIELDTERMDQEYQAPENEDEPRHDVDRFLHNLESVVSFLAKLKYLQKLRLKVICTFGQSLERNGLIERELTRFFTSLRQIKIAGSLDIAIESVVVIMRASVLQPGGPDIVWKEEALPPLLRIAKSVGFGAGEIATIVTEQKRKCRSTAADITADLQSSFNAITSVGKRFLSSQKPVSQPDEDQPEIFWRKTVYDEDFVGINEDDLGSWVGNGEWKFWISKYLSGPTYRVQNGCVITERPKYQSGGLSVRLYLSEDFYHSLGACLLSSEYQLLPECRDCGIMFSSAEQLQAHTELCAAGGQRTDK